MRNFVYSRILTFKIHKKTKLMLIDKENNANHTNVNFRKRKPFRDIKADKQIILEATFRPLPKINQVSIPILPARQSLNTPGQYSGQRLSKGKQGPVIAKSHKLKSFFGVQSERYNSRRKMTLNPRETIRNSAESIRSRKDNQKEALQSSKTIETTPSSRQKKLEFALLYQRQKAQYDKLLAKYGIEQTFEDEEYQRFMMQ